MAEGAANEKSLRQCEGLFLFAAEVRRALELANLGSLWTLLALRYLELDSGAFVQGLESSA